MRFLFYYSKHNVYYTYTRCLKITTISTFWFHNRCFCSKTESNRVLRSTRSYIFAKLPVRQTKTTNAMARRPVKSHKTRAWEENVRIFCFFEKERTQIGIFTPQGHHTLSVVFNQLINETSDYVCTGRSTNNYTIFLYL